MMPREPVMAGSLILKLTDIFQSSLSMSHPWELEWQNHFYSPTTHTHSEWFVQGTSKTERNITNVGVSDSVPVIQVTLHLTCQ